MLGGLGLGESLLEHCFMSKRNKPITAVKKRIIAVVRLILSAGVGSSVCLV
jgi:hypothetical protein